jgi:hypothetical protein
MTSSCCQLFWGRSRPLTCCHRLGAISLFRLTRSTPNALSAQAQPSRTGPSQWRSETSVHNPINSNLLSRIARALFRTINEVHDGRRQPLRAFVPGHQDRQQLDPVDLQPLPLRAPLVHLGVPVLPAPLLPWMQQRRRLNNLNKR